MKQLFDAIRAGDVAAVQSVLDESPERASAIDDDSGLPAIVVATYHGKTEIVRLLAERGAHFDLFSGSMLGRAEVVRAALAENPGAVNSFSADGWTPLHLAAFFGCRDCVHLLLDAGAKVNERSRNSMNNMPLHAAAAGRHEEIVRILLEKGAWVNARYQGGWTALHSAAQNGDNAVAELLIAAGADVNVRAENGQCPWDLAMTRGHQHMVEILEHYGAGRQ